MRCMEKNRHMHAGAEGQGLSGEGKRGLELLTGVSNRSGQPEHVYRAREQSLSVLRVGGGLRFFTPVP